MTIRFRPSITAVAACTLLVGCSNSPGPGATGVPNAPRPDVHITRNPTADFSSLQTYDWVDRSTIGQSEDTGLDAQMDRQIVAAVDSVLATKGYQRGASGVDFRVVWYGTFTGRVEEEEAKQRYPSYFQQEGQHTITTTQHVTTHWEDGTFILSMLEADSDSLIWSVHAEGAIQTSGNPEVMQERFNDGAARLLGEFPRR